MNHNLTEEYEQNQEILLNFTNFGATKFELTKSFISICTVKPVDKGHSMEPDNVSFICS